MDETYFKEEAGWPPVRVLMPEDPVMGGMDGCDNAAPKALTHRTNQLRLDLTALAHSIEGLQERLEGLSSADGPALEEALRALLEERYPYRFYETFTPGWTLIDAPPLEVVTLTTPVAGDDSIDVSDTSCLQAGCWYVLFDGPRRQEIEIKEILGQRRIRIAPALTIALSDTARLGRTDWHVAPRAALAKGASAYYARTLDLGPSAGQRAILVRGSLGAAPVACQWRKPGGAWAECVWSWQRQGVDHRGQAWQEIEYLLPARGQTQLRVTVDGQATLQRIVVLEAPSGLGGIGNGPAQPMALVPKPGETGIGAVATLTLSPYVSPTGAEQAGLEIELRRDRLTVLATGILKGALSLHALPNGLLLPASHYSWRGRYIDCRDIPSPWSDWASFETLENFASVATPSILSPADNATLNYKSLFEATPFVIVGGSDAHVESEWRFSRTADFAEARIERIVSDGKTSLTTLALTASNFILDADYFVQLRYRASSLGWSSWSPMRRMKTPDLWLPEIGEPFGGGIYAGDFTYPNGKKYALIVAPIGDIRRHIWGETISGYDTNAYDGAANTAIIAARGSPAAIFCRDYRGGGLDDWYLPAAHELLASALALRNCFEKYVCGGRDWNLGYWSSSHEPAPSIQAQLLYDLPAFGLHIAANPDGHNKYATFQCRPMRKIAIG